MRPHNSDLSLNLLRSNDLRASSQDSPAEGSRKGTLNRTGDPAYNRQIPPEGAASLPRVVTSSSSEAAMEYSAPHGEPQAERPVLSRRDAPNAHPQSERGESRTEKLARIRREIELGTYDTPERLEAAFAIMLGRLQNE